MIVDLPDTTTNDLNKKITALREEGGAITLGRVLTLVIAPDTEDLVEDSIEAAVSASREHPCRIIVVVPDDRLATSARLDGQLRVGADAGAGEVVVLRISGPLANHANSVVLPFLLPDTPVVAWWPGTAPEVPAEDAIPACAEAGVLGVLPGVLGTAQALEALKLLLGVGEPLVWRLQVFDGLGQRWQELALEKDPACAVCGGERPAPRRAEQRFPEALEPEALQARLDAGEALTLLDCREPFEWEICHLAGSTLMPMGQLALDAIPRERPVVVVCHHGPRSVHVASYLLANGYPEVAFLDGGLHAWSYAIDPSMARY